MVAHVSLPQFSVVSFARRFLKPLNCRPSHYYRNTDLSWLGNLCCPDFPTGNAKPGQKGCPFVPGLATGTKSTLLSRLVLPTGTKGQFFSVPLFSIVFLFQLYFYISIKLMYWNSVCMISTNTHTYIYIVTYIIFVLDSFHI